MLLATILKALGPPSDRYYESDDEYLPDRVPLLKNYVPPQSYVVGESAYGAKNDSWNLRTNSKVCALMILNTPSHSGMAHSLILIVLSSSFHSLNYHFAFNDSYSKVIKLLNLN